MGRGWSQDAIDAAYLLGCGVDEFDDDSDCRDFDCGLRRDGQCSQAGTEHCDFECPNRNSDLFVGSVAWRQKHGRT